MQNTRSTLYKCVVAHGIDTDDTEANIIKPTNISYWTFGDICGKRMNSCSARFGYEHKTGKVKYVRMAIDFSTVPPGTGDGDGYTSVPAVTIGTSWTADMTLAVGDYVANGDYHYKVTVSDGQAGATAPTHTESAVTHHGVRYKFWGVRATCTATRGGTGGDHIIEYDLTTTQGEVGGTGYNYIPVVTVAAPAGTPAEQAYAIAHVNLNTTQSINLPFGGFPGSALF